MNLAEIKARAEKCNQIIYETWGVAPVSADSDFEWLIARVERLEKVARHLCGPRDCSECTPLGRSCPLTQLEADE